MCSYNSLAVEGAYNSTPMCLNKDILETKLRGDWGFNGSVVADCDAVSDAYDAHHWGEHRPLPTNTTTTSQHPAGIF